MGLILLRVPSQGYQQPACFLWIWADFSWQNFIHNVEGELEEEIGFRIVRMCLLRFESKSGWWFQRFLEFSPQTLGKMNPIWRSYVSKGLVQPPTRSQSVSQMFLHPEKPCISLGSNRTTILGAYRPSLWYGGWPNKHKKDNSTL